MAAAIVQQIQYSIAAVSTASPSVTTAAFSTSPTVGNVMYLGLTVIVSTAEAITLTLTTPSGWTLVTSASESTLGEWAYLFTKTVASGDTGAVTFSGTGSLANSWNFQTDCYEVSGASTSTPVNQSTSKAITSGSSVVFSSLTPSVVGTLPIAFLGTRSTGSGGSVNHAFPTGWTTDYKDIALGASRFSSGHTSLTTDTTTAIGCTVTGEAQAFGAGVFFLAAPASAQTYNESVSDTVSTASASVSSYRTQGADPGDTFAFSSALAQQLVAGASLADAFAFGQAVVAQVQQQTNLADRVMTLSEAVSSWSIYSCNVAQNGVFTDTVAATQMVMAAVSAVMSFSDNPTASRVFSASVSDVLSFADTLKAQLAANLGIAQVNTFGSSVHATADQAATISTTFTFADAPQSLAVYQSVAAEALRLLDSLSSTIQYQVATLDRPATLTDAVHATTIATALVSDLFHFADALTNVLWLKYTTPILLSLTVQPTQSFGLVVSPSATLALTVSAAASPLI